MIAFLLHPRTWIVLLLVGFVWFIAHTFESNKRLKLELETQEKAVAELNVQTASLRVGQEIIVQDLQRIDEIAQEKQKIIVREIQIQRELDAIPKTIDAPLSDPNNFAYASRVRDYQNETLSELTRSNGN